MRLVARPPRPLCARRAYSLSLGGNAPKGLHDLLPVDHHRHEHILRTGAKLAQTYGYEKVSTPIMEHTEVFSRSLGDDSDVVMKEMYSFKDASGQELTLRPEGTAGIVRALLSHKLVRHLPQRLFYHGPMFRYEKPQRGRARQFHQFGVESFGIGHPSAEVEAIAFAHRFLESVGLAGGFTLELSSLGDADSRSKYRVVLKDYLEAHKAQLSPESVARLERGSVLRVLDSKEAADQPLVKDAPRIDAHYTPAAKERFLEVQEGLRAAKVPFVVNPLLMRGLDYYSHSIWECVSQHPSLVGQRTLLAGGRYDDLVSLLRGGRGDPVPAIGWAAGIERLSLVLKDFTPPKGVRPVALIVVRNDSQDSYVKSPVARQAIALIEELRRADFPVLYFPNGGASKQLQKALASPVQPFAALFLGEDEVAQQCVQLKMLDTQTQSVCKLEGLAQRLREVQDKV